MRGRVGRIATTAILATGVGVSGALLGATAAEAAPQPVVAGDCNATVTGHAGQPVALNLGAVLGLPNSAQAGPYLQVGAIPQAGAKTINAAPLVQKAAQDKGLIGNVVGGLTNALAGGCGITATAVNGVAAPVQQGAQPLMKAVQPGTAPLAATLRGALPGSTVRPPATPPSRPQPPAPGPGQPGQPGQPGGGAPGQPSGGAPGQNNAPLPAGTPYPIGLLYGQLGYGPNGFVSPTSLFGSLPLGAQGFNGQGFGIPGMMAPPTGAGYGLQIPGFAPSAGQLNVGPADNTGDPVRNAGSAQALPATGTSSNPVGLPLLLAVIVLSGVTAGLVRTFLLRRVSN